MVMIELLKQKMGSTNVDHIVIDQDTGEEDDDEDDDDDEDRSRNMT